MALNPQQERIGTFLAQGLKPAQITSIVGVTAAYISQLAADPDFQEFVKLKAAEYQKETGEEELVTAKYLAIEHKLLGAMEVAMMGAELPALTAALKAIVDRQEKRALRKQGVLVPGGMVNNQFNVTVLQLPSHAVPEYQVNSQGQVMQINGQGLSPMNSLAVKKMFQARKAPLVIPQEREVEVEPPDF